MSELVYCTECYNCQVDKCGKGHKVSVGGRYCKDHIIMDEDEK